MKRLCALMLTVILCILLAGAALAQSVNYIVKLEAWVPIYTEPGYDAASKRIVGEDGRYTITEEQLDEEGNIWGKLKSGAGWVDLTRLRTMGEPPVTATYAGILDLEYETYNHVVVEKSPYMTKIAFRANEMVTDVAVTTLEYAEWGYRPGQTLHKQPLLKEDTYLVVGVVFYGDMTAYGISFFDDRGAERHYAVTVSGRNGDLEMQEYVY